MNAVDLVHPAVAAWFTKHFAAPTHAQAHAWPAIQAGGHTLIVAPTGFGNTLAAFLTAIGTAPVWFAWGRDPSRDKHRRHAARRAAAYATPAATHLVTTPESLYVLLGSTFGRVMLATTRTVIVDEIHAMASNKRGVHLALSLSVWLLYARKAWCESVSRRHKTRSA
jgi:ATP-dependent helicase Lhr and Lhr-like helicase